MSYVLRDLWPGVLGLRIKALVQVRSKGFKAKGSGWRFWGSIRV